MMDLESRELVTGQPFIFDPVERTVSWSELPEAMGAVDGHIAEFEVVSLPR